MTTSSQNKEEDDDDASLTIPLNQATTQPGRPAEREWEGRNQARKETKGVHLLLECEVLLLSVAQVLRNK